MPAHDRPRHFSITALRVLLLAGAVLAVAWAIVDPSLRDAEGSLRAEFCIPIAIALAFAVEGLFVGGPFQASAAWFGVALVGAASVLQLVEAGPAIRYQHIAPAWTLLDRQWLPWTCIVIAQGLLVARGCSRRWASLGHWTRGLTRSQLAIAVLLLALSSATVSADVRRYLTEIPVAASIQAINVLNVVLIAAAFPESRLERLTQWLDEHLGRASPDHSPEPGGIDRFAVGAAIWTVALAALLSVLSYERHPHVPDEVSYLYQARYFAKGLLDLPVPPVRQAFNVDLMTYEATRWYSPFPPGWPAMLAVGVLIGLPWLVNPVLAGVNVLLCYVLLRELFDRRSSRLGVVLLATSPWMLFMAMSFMPHTVMLTWALAAAVAVAKARRTRRASLGLIGGAAVGATSIVRPLDGVVLGTLLALWLIGTRGLRLRLPTLGAFAVGALLVGSLLLPYNKFLTGHPTRFPVMAYFDRYYGPKSNALGFGPERGVGWPLDPFPGHSPLESLINTNLNVFTLNTDLFGWSTGSLLFVVLCIAAGVRRRTDRLAIAVIVATVGLHAFYWYGGGPDFGPRYWSLILVPCVMLTISGFDVVARNLAGQSGRAWVALLSLSAIALAVHVPWRAIDKYHHFRGMRSDIRQLAASVPFGRSLVLVRGCRHPDYASAATYNPLDLTAAVPIYAWDHDRDSRAQVLTLYRDRPVWILDGPTVTHRGYEVRAGPLFAVDVMNRTDLQSIPTCASPKGARR